MTAALSHELDLPTLDEELNRKTLDTLEWILRSREQGKITTAQTDIALGTLFSVVSGLVGDDIFELIGVASGEVKKQDKDVTYFERHILEKDDGDCVLIEREIGSSKISMRKFGKWHEEREKSFADAYSPEIAAQEGVERLIKLMRSKGYQPVKWG